VVQVSAERGSSDAKGDLVLYTNGGSLTERMRIDEDGHITKPTQSAFLVKPDANQDSLAINTYHTVQFDEEKFDQNGDFNTTNYTFTAPVTGKYQLNTQVYLYNIDEGADYYLIYIDTSNNDYQVILDPGGYDADINYQTWVISTLADMDASDTAVVKVYQQAGSQQVNLISGGYTWFSGFLAC
jgi:C1q domain.